MIYLATPYSHPDQKVRELRFQHACIAAATLMRDGVTVFCPIAHTHPIAVIGGLPLGWDFWQRYDQQMLALSAAIWIVKMDGWEQSRGIASEIEYAVRQGIPVKYLELGDVGLEARTPCEQAQ